MVEDEAVPLTTGQDRTYTLELTHPAGGGDELTGGGGEFTGGGGNITGKGDKFTGGDDEFTGKDGDFTGRNVSTYEPRKRTLISSPAPFSA
eukprot:1181540-Prorocentrum_minimum.AAC.3